MLKNNKDKKQQNNNEDQQKEKREFQKRATRIRLVLGAFCILLVLMFGDKAMLAFQHKVSYNDFMTQVEDGRVESVDIDKTTGKVTFLLKDDKAKETYYTNYPYTETFVENLLKSDVEIEIHQTSWFVYVLKYGISPLMFIVLIYIFLNLNKLNSGDFEIEPIENNKTKFSNVAGMEELKEDLMTLSDMMKNSEYRKCGARIPRGILLQGPPGNGKTLLARAFAGETGVNFIAVNACDFGSQFIGIGSSKIKKVFEVAKANAPCVIFIDEIDSVGSKRSAQQDAAGKEMNTMLTALLNQMDGFKQMDNVMVLAATNRADDLDEALVRPGRFDRQFIVGYPDKTTRTELFKLYTRSKKISNDVDFNRLSIKTFGYSCSKIECIVNEAIILSIREKHDFVSMNNFEEAIIQMDMKGHIKKHYTQTEEEKRTVAYHEAGHAIVTYFATNKEVTTITIRPTTSGAGGFTVTESENESSLCPIEDYKNELVMLYGGRASEVILRGSIEKASAGASQDISQATHIATSYVSIEDGIDYSAFGKYGIEKVMLLSEDLLKKAWKESYNIVKQHWDSVCIIAEKLIENESVSKEQFVELLQDKNTARED